MDFCLSFPLFLQFPDETLRSGELLNMIVAVIDSAQVNTELSSQVCREGVLLTGALLLAAAVCTFGPRGWEGMWSPRAAGWV